MTVCVIALKVRSLNLNNTLHSKGELKVATSLMKSGGCGVTSCQVYNASQLTFVLERKWFRAAKPTAHVERHCAGGAS